VAVWLTLRTSPRKCKDAGRSASGSYSDAWRTVDRESAQVFVSNRAGDAPSQLLFSSPGTTAPYRDTWMTLDGEGNLLLQPDERANVFFRQREQGGWDRFSLRLPSAEITRLVAGPRLPGGGSVLFFVQQGIGLWRVELPGPAK
jgi:hypothetical protein